LKMKPERIQFGNNLMDELESRIKDLDPKLTKLDLEETMAYMHHIRGKMIAQFYFQDEDPEIWAQVMKMTKCIDTVRELINKQDATAM
jgi:hypothetical protein